MTTQDRYTTKEKWNEMDDATRYFRLKMAQRVANAFGRPGGVDDLPITPPETWNDMSESAKLIALSNAEIECANRAQFVAERSRP